MQSANNFVRISALALGIAGALAVGNAKAEAFHLKENSVKAEGRAMAGAASAKGDTSVVVNNPAVMSTFTQTTAQVDATLIDLSFKFNGGGRDGLGNPLTGDNGGDAGGLNPVPAMSIVAPLHGGFEGLTVGAMVSAPFGLKTEYDNGWVGRYHALTSDVKVVDLTLAASVNLSDTFSVGAGLIIERADVTLSNAIDFGTGICKLAAIFCAPGSAYGPQMNDGAAKIEGHDTNLGWIVGASHRSEVDHEISGTADFTVPANVAPLLAIGAPGQYLDGKGGAKLTLPSIDTVSVTWQATDKLALMSEYQRTDWHSLQEIRITFGNPQQPDTAETYAWEDSNFYSLGGEYKFNDAFTFRAGLGRDESPVSRPYRTPRLPDTDRNFYSAGLTWAPGEHWEISGSYTRVALIHKPEVEIVSVDSGQGALLEGKFSGGADLYGISAQYKF
jgi:long-chain fatty acid transport protein